MKLNTCDKRINPSILLIFGPTAVGKTALLNRLFHSNIEIISADSMQVYQGMDIGTAKPSLEERSRVPHHLIDIYPPSRQFHAGEFVTMVDELVPQIRLRGNLPVISGGTAYYLKNYLYGLSKVPPTDLLLAKEMMEKLLESDQNQKESPKESSYREELYAQLQKVDPISAKRIHINDSYRLVRAMEVWMTSKRPLSSFAVSNEPRFPHQLLAISLYREREELYRRIDDRVSLMMKAGLPQEVEALMRQGFTLQDPGMKAIGYQEFFHYPKEPSGEWSEEALNQIQSTIQKNSRHYAKKQLTFFKSLKGVHWMKADDFEGINQLLIEKGLLPH